MLILLAVHASVAVLLPLVAHRLGRGVWAVAALAPLSALVWAVTRASSVGHGAVTEGLEWASTLGLRFDVRVDALALVMVFVVSGVGVAVLAYSAYYVEEGAGRLAALLVAFAGAMLGLVTADHLISLYLFWELTTVLSFLLIGGAGGSSEERRAAVQALLTTAAGGLVMLLGLLMLGEAAGTYRLSAIVADPPSGGLTPVALVLVVIGAMAKSAQFPLQAWLPAAMVAPTPVSAYLHAAAMVKAGVYLVARLSPAFADVGAWRAAVVAVGLTGMVLAGWRALRETDLKGLLAYGTISELGLLTALFGAGSAVSALAAVTMLVAHALFKSALFLVVGVVDHQAGTRDLRELSGVGRRLPVLCAVAVVAAASMAGLPPTIGFLGKEAAYDAFLHDFWPMAGLVAGSVLTVAYSARFLWGAFGRKPGVEPTRPDEPAKGFVAVPALLATAGVALGIWHAAVASPASTYAEAYATPDYHLALWHGFTPVLGLSVLTVLAGVALHFAALRFDVVGGKALPDAQAVYAGIVRVLDVVARQVTRRTQVGSLPVYLGVVMCTVLVLPGVALVLSGTVVPRIRLWTTPIQVPLAVVVLVAAVAVATARRRLTAVLLVGFVGYGVAGMFVLHGAPDLALTQFLVESLTLVVFVLVLRRMPVRFSPDRPGRSRRAEERAAGSPPGRGRSARPLRWPRAVLAAAVGAFVGLFALSVTAVRHPSPVSDAYFGLLHEAGAHNAVNAILVDFRALDTLGEISVLMVTAIGAAGLVMRSRGSERRADQDAERAAERAAGQDDDEEVRS
ncbi:hydrogen gas-evolving membrane-bound hydrogenase subunit E [Saccharothrix isguenensis]